MQLREAWKLELSESKEPVRLDVLYWLGKITLDVIGLAGFNYQLNSLHADGNANELSTALADMFDPSAMRLTAFSVIKVFFPIIGFIVRLLVIWRVGSY